MILVSQDSSGKGAQHLLNAVAQGSCLIATNPVVDPLSNLFTLDQPRFAQQPKVMRHGGLLDGHRRLEIADAYAAFVAGQHVQQLQSHRMREVFEIGRDRRRVVVAATRARLHVAAAIAQLTVYDLESSRHNGRLAGISTLVNICNGQEA